MNMKKDFIFAPALLVIGVLLCIFKLTGVVAHIAVSVVGILVLVAYTVLTKKEWKIPALEIAMRVCYGVALITGIIVMNVAGVAAVAIIHKISAILFIVLLAVAFVQKFLSSRKA